MVLVWFWGGLDGDGTTEMSRVLRPSMSMGPSMNTIHVQERKIVTRSIVHVPQDGQCLVYVILLSCDWVPQAEVERYVKTERSACGFPVMSNGNVDAVRYAIEQGHAKDAVDRIIVALDKLRKVKPEAVSAIDAAVSLVCVERRRCCGLSLTTLFGIVSYISE